MIEFSILCPMVVRPRWQDRFAPECLESAQQDFTCRKPDYLPLSTFFFEKNIGIPASGELDGIAFHEQSFALQIRSRLDVEREDCYVSRRDMYAFRISLDRQPRKMTGCLQLEDFVSV